METNSFKSLPCGKTDFRELILQNYAYIDKTHFIEKLENASNCNYFFIRPRNFGKSLFISTLMNYYDINTKDECEKLFGNLYTGKHPTPEKNRYAILKFDFSGLDASEEESFRSGFFDKIRQGVKVFLERYKELIADAEQLIQRIKEKKDLGFEALSMAFNPAHLNKIKIFLIVDEYYHFTNNILSMGKPADKDLCHTREMANRLICAFYERIKSATACSSVHNTFIAGVSPVMFDNITSEYNIDLILTDSRRYNEIQ